MKNEEFEGDLTLFISSAMRLGLNYVFIDKGMIDDDDIKEFKKLGYSVVVGQGECARIKISW